MVELNILLRRAFALAMLNKFAALVAVVSVIAAPRAGVATEPSTKERAWLTHTDPKAGLEISYPADWEVIVAEQRLGPGTAWSPLILGEGELFKVAFRESGDVPWPGWYEVRVLANNDSLTLDAYWAVFDLSDLWDRSDSDSTLAGRLSKTWVRWRHDSLVREHLLVTLNRAIHILYDEHNSNDLAFEDHQEVYEHMTSTFKVLLLSEPEAPATGRTTSVAVARCDRLLPAAADVPTGVFRETNIQGMLLRADVPKAIEYAIRNPFVGVFRGFRTTDPMAYGWGKPRRVGGHNSFDC